MSKGSENILVQLSAYGAHLDFTSEDWQVKGELELGVSEFATAGVSGIWTN